MRKSLRYVTDKIWISRCIPKLRQKFFLVSPQTHHRWQLYLCLCLLSLHYLLLPPHYCDTWHSIQPSCKHYRCYFPLLIFKLRYINIFFFNSSIFWHLFNFWHLFDTFVNKFTAPWKQYPNAKNWSKQMVHVQVTGSSVVYLHNVTVLDPQKEHHIVALSDFIIIIETESTLLWPLTDLLQNSPSNCKKGELFQISDRPTPLGV